MNQEAGSRRAPWRLRRIWSLRGGGRGGVGWRSGRGGGGRGGRLCGGCGGRGQGGGAGAAFARMVQREVGGEGVAGRLGDARAMRRLKFWAGAASSLAACLAVVVGLQVWHRASTVEVGATNGGHASTPVVDQVE